MEDKIAELMAKVAELEASAGVTNTMFAETYYYLTIPLMIIIHAGFLAYEMGSSRAKNVLSSGVKNILAKQLGSSNPLNNARAATDALNRLQTFTEISDNRNLTV